MDGNSVIIAGMNKLPLAKRAQILTLLCEGSSMRSIERIVGCSINTVDKLLRDAGEVALAYHDEHVRGVKAERVQCDEVWSFVHAKAKNAPKSKRAGDPTIGDCWTWTAIDADIKLLLSYLVGGRDAEFALMLMDDLRGRLANRVQLTTDGHRAYLQAVEEAFGADIDYSMLIKLYGEPPSSPEAARRYSPSECVGTRKDEDHRQPRSEACQHVLRRAGEPHDADGDASVYPADQRVQQEARKPRAHGRALCALVQLRPHPQDAADEPAMAAGIETRLWSMEDVVRLVEQREDLRSGAALVG